MAGWVKVTLYFINSLFLYFVIGIIACNIPFPIMGMIAGAPSVFIAVVTLAFARTLEVYMQGNCRIDLKNYLHALIDLIMIILGVTLLVAVIYAMYLCYFMIN